MQYWGAKPSLEEDASQQHQIQANQIDNLHVYMKLREQKIKIICMQINRSSRIKKQ